MIDHCTNYGKILFSVAITTFFIINMTLNLIILKMIYEQTKLSYSCNRLSQTIGIEIACWRLPALAN